MNELSGSPSHTTFWHGLSFIARGSSVTEKHCPLGDVPYSSIGSGLWQCCAEPRRVIELAAGASGTTPLTIPQRIVLVYHMARETRPRVCSVTEVVVSDERGDLIWPVDICVRARTNIPWVEVGISFIECSCKCPDVLS